MEIKKITDSSVIIESFQKKKLLIIPTDTIYGFACIITAKESLERIYYLKNRNKNKPLSIIVANLHQAEQLVYLSSKEKKLLKQKPSITVIAPIVNEQKLFFPLQKTLGVRITSLKWLQEVILKVGPIFATSVNISGDEYSKSLEELSKFSVDLLIYDGEIKNFPSKIYDSINKKMIR